MIPIRQGTWDYDCRCCTSLTSVHSEGETCPDCREHSFGSSDVQNFKRTQDHLVMARRFVTALREQVRRERAAAEVAAAAAVAAERQQHVCPGQDEIKAAMVRTASALRTREEAFALLAGVHERHSARDGKYCRCGRALAHCPDHQAVHGHALLERWMDERG